MTPQSAARSSILLTSAAVSGLDDAYPDSLAQIMRKIPKAQFEKRPLKAWLTLGRDLLLAFALGALIVKVNSWLLALPLAMLLGCVLTGLFVIGHDAGHRSFSNSKRMNDLIGHGTMALTLWPFHVWRLSHDVHHRWTHHADKEIAWKPLTVEEYDALPAWQRYIYLKSRTTLFFWASLLFQYFMILYALTDQFFEAKHRRILKNSLIFTAFVGVFYSAASFWLAGTYGLIMLFVIPQLVYQFWLSTMTLLHHTDPDSELMSAEEWTPEQAQLGSSINVRYPRLVDWLTHDIAWHVPHHVCVAIPHYHLKAAHYSLKSAYGDRVIERKASWDYVKPILTNCHLMGSTRAGGQKWLRVVSKNQASPRVAQKN